MTEIAVPDPDNLTLTGLSLSSPAQVNRSGWTSRRKVIGLPGAELWRGNAAIEQLATEEEERPWRAFLFGLRGPLNWFRWPLPCNQHAGNRPQVRVAGATGYSLPLTGMAASATILTAGQFMTIPLPGGHSRAVVLTADLVTNGQGLGTASFVPALGQAPTVGATVESMDPFIPMALVEREQGFAMSDGLSRARFDVEEAL